MSATRTDVLNKLIDTYGYVDYLEIGTQTREQNFNKIKAKNKLCVDPDNNAKPDFRGTSDDFFKQNKKTFDLIFIDGLHTAEQSMKDFQNAIDCLNEGGAIVFHDTYPDNLEYTKPIWCGDVYKTIIELKHFYHIITVIDDHGVSVVLPWLEEDRAFEAKQEFSDLPKLAPVKFSDLVLPSKEPKEVTIEPKKRGRKSKI
jgi:SAM-dependent methyltransferase